MPAAHRRLTESRHRWVLATIVAVAAIVLAGASALVVTRVDHTTAAVADTVAPPPPLSVVSTTPSSDSSGVPSDAAVGVQFSQPLAPDSPTPTLVPPVPGTWVRSGVATMAFESASPLPPGSTVTVSVPGGDSGVRGARGQHLASSMSTSFTVAPMSTLRLQQLLAGLGYLPVAFTPSDTTPLASNEVATAQLGTFSWRWTTMPGNFMALWSPGQPNVVTQGAIMAFESQHDMKTDGVAGPQVWSALLQATTAGQVDTSGHYDWVSVSEARPEQVTVWRDGAAVYNTLANTGISSAPTEQGTWPVYVRYTSTTMSGTNPDGSHYSDPGVPWVSYFHGGDALHGFIRPGYGYPQSLGCVEMPIPHAEVVYPYTPIGTLVTVA